MLNFNILLVGQHTYFSLKQGLIVGITISLDLKDPSSLLRSFHFLVYNCHLIAN